MEKLLSQLGQVTTAASQAPQGPSPYENLVNVIKEDAIEISSKDPAMLNLPIALAKAANTGIALRGILYLAKFIDHQYAKMAGIPYYAMSLMAGETGGTFNPRASFNGIAIIGEKRIPTIAYGLLQQTRSNWDAGIEMAQLTDITNYAMSTRTLPLIAKMSHTKLSDLINPMIYYGPAYSEVYQIIPAGGQLVSLVGKISEQWTFNPGLGWQCLLRASDLKNPAILEQFKAIAGKYLLSKELGYMSLMTLYHINGGGILTRGTALPSYFKERVKKDCQSYQLLKSSPEAYSLVTDTHAQSFEDTRMMPAMVDTVITDTHKGHLNRDYPNVGGTDLRAAFIPVYAPRAGTVTKTTTQGTVKSGGKNIHLLLNSGEVVFLCHLSAISVKPNTKVAQGQQIGVTGNSGDVAPHLHVRVEKGGKIIDAEKASFGLQWLLNSDYGLSDEEIRIKHVSYK